MRRSLLLVLICASTILYGCAGPRATRPSATVTRTQELVQAWSEIWIGHYRLTGSLPTARGSGPATDDAGQLLGVYTQSLNGRGGNLAMNDSWGTQLRCSKLPPADGRSGPMFVIASPGPNRIFDSDLKKATASGDCSVDDVIYRVVLANDRTPPKAGILIAGSTSQPTTAAPPNTPK